MRTEVGLLRAGLIIKSRVNVENLCPCRQSRQWGTMCAHSIGVGLWVLQQESQNAAKKSRARESLAERRPLNAIPSLKEVGETS